MRKKTVSWILVWTITICCAIPARAQTFVEDGYVLYEPDALPAAADGETPSDGLPVTVARAVPSAASA